MSTLYALLWKEGREILPKVLVAVALAVVVCLMRRNVDFNRSYAEGFEVLIMGGLVLMAIVLAMDAIARERNTGTLSFLIDKPVTGATVLAVKFLVGLGGLLLVALMAWATVYIDLASLEASRAWLAYKLVTVQSIDYASMVALSFTQFSLLYALVFIGSVMTDHPFKGAAVGIALAVMLGVFLTGPATAIFPLLNRYPLVAIGLDDQGHLVRLATDSARFWVKVLANMVLTAAALVVAVVLLRRYREAILPWRTVAIGWGAIIAVVFAIFYGGPLVNQRMPAGVLEAPDKQHYEALAVQGGLAYIDHRTKRKRFRYQQYWGATDGGLLLVRERGYALVAEAFALDAEGMPVVGDERVIMPIPDPVDGPNRWKRRCHVSVRGSRAYIGTEHELVVIDVADAHALREIGRYTLESFRPQSYYDSRLVATDGDKLYVERFWPQELVEFDITNLDQLREVGYLPLPRSDGIRVVDGMVYRLIQRSSGVGVRTWTIAEYGALIEGGSLVDPDRDRWGFGPPSVANGYLYVPRGGALVAYRLD